MVKYHFLQWHSYCLWLVEAPWKGRQSLADLVSILSTGGVRIEEPSQFQLDFLKYKIQGHGIEHGHDFRKYLRISCIWSNRLCSHWPWEFVNRGLLLVRMPAYHVCAGLGRSSKSGWRFEARSTKSSIFCHRLKVQERNVSGPADNTDLFLGYPLNSNLNSKWACT